MEDHHIGEKPETEAELRLRPEEGIAPIGLMTKAGAVVIGYDATDIKDPDGDLTSPASMPADQQGEARSKRLHHDLEGQQAGTNGGGHETT